MDYYIIIWTITFLTDVLPQWGALTQQNLFTFQLLIIDNFFLQEISSNIASCMGRRPKAETVWKGKNKDSTFIHQMTIDSCSLYSVWIDSCSLYQLAKKTACSNLNPKITNLIEKLCFYFSRKDFCICHIVSTRSKMWISGSVWKRTSN